MKRTKVKTSLEEAPKRGIAFIWEERRRRQVAGQQGSSDHIKMRKSTLPFSLELHVGAQSPTLKTAVEEIISIGVFLAKKKFSYRLSVQNESKTNKANWKAPSRSRAPAFASTQSTEVSLYWSIRGVEVSLGCVFSFFSFVLLFIF